MIESACAERQKVVCLVFSHGRRAMLSLRWLLANGMPDGQFYGFFCFVVVLYPVVSAGCLISHSVIFGLPGIFSMGIVVRAGLVLIPFVERCRSFLA